MNKLRTYGLVLIIIGALIFIGLAIDIFAIKCPDPTSECNAFGWVAISFVWFLYIPPIVLGTALWILGVVKKNS